MSAITSNLSIRHKSHDKSQEQTHSSRQMVGLPNTACDAGLGVNFFDMVPRVSIATVLALLGAIAGTISAHDFVSIQFAHGFVPKVELHILPGQLDRGLP